MRVVRLMPLTHLHRHFNMYFNRDLSWLSFNYRVLLEAADSSVPLNERLKFYAIFSSNLDEFFRVRYPTILALTKLSKKTKASLNEVQENILERVQTEVNRQLVVYGATLTEKILPALSKKNIRLYWNSEIEQPHIDEVDELFMSKVLSFIRPVIVEGIDKVEFYPENNQIYFVVFLKEKEGLYKHAIVNIPASTLQRFYVLSPVGKTNYVIFIDDLVRTNISTIFPNHYVQGVYSFKINRDSELHLDDYNGNLRERMEKQLSKRDFGPPTRFLYEEGMPRNIQLFLASVFGVKHDEMFMGGRYHNLSDFLNFPVFDETLSYPPQKPLTIAGLKHYNDIFQVISRKNILLHLPYHSYNAVLAFFNQAAVDPDVSEIYITLYRVASESHIVNALLSAAKNGKKVTVFVELKARFDEANNLKWSKVMEEAGVNILYSFPSIKVHSKTALVKKVVATQEVHFAVLSTGNFNESTARFYTDHVLLTSDVTITSELTTLFEYLQNKKHKPLSKAKFTFNRLMVSQFNFVKKFEELVSYEMEKAVEGKPAHIRIKVNNLEEHNIINLLYKASQAGVKIDLIVRSICCIVPGVEGMSEHITVKRLVGRYLEHSRIFIFGDDEAAKVIIGSADLMKRNLHSRIEVCVEVKEEACRKQLLNYFNIQWSDNEKAVVLDEFLNQTKASGTSPEKVIAQEEIYHYLKTINEEK